MSKLILPTAGSVNWGSALNAYLKSLDTRIDTFERRYGGNSDYETVRNLGYASSGWSGENVNISYDAATDKVSIYGTVFISGDVNMAKTWDSTEPFTSATLEPSATGNAIFYFVILKYTKNSDTWSVSLETEFDCSYTDVLLGFYRRKGNNTSKDFVPYYYSSMKTIMQHYEEIYRRWIDLDATSSWISVTITAGVITNITLNPTTFNMYAGGLATAARVTGSEINKTTMAKIKPYTITNSSIVYYLQDSMDESGKLVTTWCNTTAPSLATEDEEKANIYRVMVNVFGDIFVQKAYINDGTDIVDASYWSEQQLYNTRFCKNFTQYQTAGDPTSTPTLALDASLFVEIARFGYQGKINNANYGQSNAAALDDGTNGYVNNITFVKALNQGVATQMANNIWLTQNSQIWWNNVSFKKTNSDVDTTYLTHNHGGTTSSNKTHYFCFDGTIADGTDNGDTLGHASKLLLQKTKINDKISLCSDDSQDDPTQKCSLVLDKGTASLIAHNKGLTITSEKASFSLNVEMAESTQITFVSDRRRKDNFEPVSESYLSVIENVPVLYYTYKNSDKQQVGIIAQDLEKVLPSHNQCFINIQNTNELLNQRSLYETKLIYILWKALQEEIQERKKLEKKLDALK